MVNRYYVCEFGGVWRYKSDDSTYYWATFEGYNQINGVYMPIFMSREHGPTDAMSITHDEMEEIKAHYREEAIKCEQ